MARPQINCLLHVPLCAWMLVGGSFHMLLFVCVRVCIAKARDIMFVVRVWLYAHMLFCISFYI